MASLFLFSRFVYSEEKELKSETSITTIEPEYTEAKTYIHIKFNRDPEWTSLPAVENHQTFAQIDFANTKAGVAGKFWDVNSKIISKIAIFQPNENDAAIRIFPQEGYELSSDDLQIERLGSRLIISVLHSSADSSATVPSAMGPPFIKKVEEREPLELGSQNHAHSSTNVEINDDRPKKRETDENELIPQKDLARESTKAQVVTGASDSRETNYTLGVLTKIAAFLAVLIVISLAIMTKRKFALLKAMDQESGKIPAIVSLSTLSLSQKQKISLIQVGAERFLIGVSPTEIKLLTEISSQKAAEKVDYGSTKHKEILGNEFASKLALEPIKNESRRNHDPQPKTLEPLKLKSKQLMQKGEVEKVGNEYKSESRLENKTKKSPRVRIAIGDDGIKDLSPRKDFENAPIKSEVTRPSQNVVVDDVTKLIRDRITSFKGG